MDFLRGLSRKQKIWLGIAGFVGLMIIIGSLAPGNDEAENTTPATTTQEGSGEAEATTAENATTQEASPEEAAAADLTSQAELALQEVEAALVDADQAGETKFLPSPVRRAYRAVNTFLSDGSISVRELKRARGPVRTLDSAADGRSALIAAIRANAAPKPIVLTGSGSKVNTITLKRNGPVIVESHHTGSSNFVLQLVGNGHDDLLVNEIGGYDGTVATTDETKAGRYRLSVEADGSWTVKVQQPTVTGTEKPITQKLSDTGSEVIPVSVGSSMQPVVRTQHRGQSNFAVYLIGYGDVSGTILLFNEIGNYSGEILADQEIPDGTYLVAVEADGRWTLKFAP
jgi:hypothetical protein